ncbi:chorismate mutase [Streptomyces sp. NPDC051994]|uniref:chorismate mutase n=1 Tax=unclassified Streptomyces TaxID=2593676 RepID=UPI00342E4535
MTQQVLSGTDPAVAEAAIANLRSSIDALDAEILTLLERRRELSEGVQRARMSTGGRRTEFSRENVIIKRYADLFGRPGGAIAMTILEICRGSTSTRASSIRR